MHPGKRQGRVHRKISKKARHEQTGLPDAQSNPATTVFHNSRSTIHRRFLEALKHEMKYHIGSQKFDRWPCIILLKGLEAR